MKALLPFAALLAVVLSACGGTAAGSSTKPQSQVSSRQPVPTKRHAPLHFSPKPLLNVQSTAHDYVTRSFHAAKRWQVAYRVRCDFVTNMDPTGGDFEILGDNPAKPNAAELGILFSTGQSGKAKQSTTVMESPGWWKLHVITGAGCNWHIVVNQLA